MSILKQENEAKARPERFIRFFSIRFPRARSSRRWNRRHSAQPLPREQNELDEGENFRGRDKDGDFDQTLKEWQTQHGESRDTFSL